MKSHHKKVWTCAITITFILFFCTFSFAQMEDIKGVKFKDGSIIYGKVIEMNINVIRIETEDGKIISRKFDDVAYIIKDTGVDAKQEAKTPLYAQDTGFYIGIGGNYALENIDVSEVNDYLASDEPHVDFDNSPGFNVKVGYHFSKLFSAEFVYDYFSDFSSSDTTIISGVPVKLDVEIEIMTFMIAGKLSPDVGSEVVRPFVTAGAGIMQGKVDAKRSELGLSESDSETESDFCGKLGVGIDFYATKNISVGTEVSYVMGFGNVDNIRYTNFNVGVSYHF